MTMTDCRRRRLPAHEAHDLRFSDPDGALHFCEAGPISSLIARIAEASTEQADGFANLATAVSQQEKASQQNAEMVEETIAAVQSLDAQTRDLNQLVSVFKLDASDLSGSSMRAA